MSRRFAVPGYPHRDELTFVSHTVRGRQAARVSLRDDETVVMLVCRAELMGADRLWRGDPRPALRQAYGQMGWEVPELLDAMDGSDDMYFDRVSQIHLPQWSAGRVALVGDAAACPSLLAGEGTGLARSKRMSWRENCIEPTATVPARWQRTRAGCGSSFQPNRRERCGSADSSHRRRPWGLDGVHLGRPCVLAACCSRSRSGRALCTTISHCLSTRWVEQALERRQKINALRTSKV